MFRKGFSNRFQLLNLCRPIDFFLYVNNYQVRPTYTQQCVTSKNGKRTRRTAAAAAAAGTKRFLMENKYFVNTVCTYVRTRLDLLRRDAKITKRNSTRRQRPLSLQTNLSGWNIYYRSFSVISRSNRKNRHTKWHFQLDILCALLKSSRRCRKLTGKCLFLNARRSFNF